jgi:hypothetical protein
MTDYGTVAEVKTALGLKIDEASKDGLISQYLGMVTQAINSYIGRDLRATDRTEYIDGTGKSYIYTKQSPIISVTTLQDQVNKRDSSAVVTLTSGDFIIYNEIGQIIIDPNGLAPISEFCNYPQGVKVVYRSGYEESNIPGDIKFAFIQLVSYWTGLKTKSYMTPDGVVGSVTLVAGDIPTDIKNLLDRYRKIKL